MHAESLLWRKIRPALLMAGLDPVRVENPIHPGTPDVNLADGRWIELKSAEAPVRDRTILRIAHFTPQQRVWLLRRWRRAPGTTWLLLEVRRPEGNEWLLFGGDVAAQHVGRVTLAEHRAHACARAEDGQTACRLLVDPSLAAVEFFQVADLAAINAVRRFSRDAAGLDHQERDALERAAAALEASLRKSEVAPA